MSEYPLKRQAIDRVIAATQHIRDCKRCRRVYGVAFDSSLAARGEEYAKLYLAFHS